MPPSKAMTQFSESCLIKFDYPEVVHAAFENPLKATSILEQKITPYFHLLLHMLQHQTAQGSSSQLTVTLLSVLDLLAPQKEGFFRSL